jgi:hypothetical protein
MTELPENIDSQGIGGALLAMQRDIRDVRSDQQTMRNDHRAMRDQVDVLVITSLRLERGMASLREDVREPRDRINRLEDAR